MSVQEQEAKNTSAEDRASEILFGDKGHWRSEGARGWRNVLYFDEDASSEITFSQLVKDIRIGARK